MFILSKGRKIPHTCGAKSDITTNGYKSFNFYRKFQNRRSNRYSGGIVLHIKDCSSDGIKIVRNHFDSVIWLKVDKIFFRIDNDVCIAGVYILGDFRTDVDTTL